MTEPLVLDPPSAVAASRCLITRLWKMAPIALDDAFHPRPCAWEDWSRRDLAQMLDDFNRTPVTHPDIERFRRMTQHEQRAAIRAAQYPEAAA